MKRLNDHRVIAILVLGVGQSLSFSQENTSPDLVAQAVDSQLSVTADTVRSAVQSVAPVRQGAYAARALGNHAHAAELFSSVAAGLPDSPPKMDALLLGGWSYGQSGNLASATAAYDQLWRIGKLFTVRDHRLPNERVPKLFDASEDSVRDIMKRGLADKIKVCAAAGDRITATAALSLYRVEFPEYPYLRKLLSIQADLQNVSAATLESSELKAWQLSDQAKHAWGTRDATTAMQLADTVITQYPDTVAVLTAAKTKAEVLRWAKRPEEMVAACDLILSLAGAESDAPLARWAAAKKNYVLANTLFHDVMADVLRVRPVAIERWAELLSACNEVMEKETDPVTRAIMHRVLISSYFWKREYAKVIEETPLFDSTFNRDKGILEADYKPLFVGCDVDRAESLMHLKRFDDVVSTCDRLTSSNGQRCGTRTGMRIQDYRGTQTHRRELGGSLTMLSVRSGPRPILTGTRP